LGLSVIIRFFILNGEIGDYGWELYKLGLETSRIFAVLGSIRVSHGPQIATQTSPWKALRSTYSVGPIYSDALIAVVPIPGRTSIDTGGESGCIGYEQGLFVTPILVAQDIEGEAFSGYICRTIQRGTSNSALQHDAFRLGQLRTGGVVEVYLNIPGVGAVVTHV